MQTGIRAAELEMALVVATEVYRDRCSQSQALLFPSWQLSNKRYCLIRKYQMAAIITTEMESPPGVYEK